MTNFSKTFKTKILPLLLIAVLLTMAAAPALAPTRFRALLVESTLQVLGASTFTGATNTGTLTNIGTFANSGAIVQVGALGVTGDSTLTGALGVTGATTLTGAVGITGNSTLAGNATVTGTLGVSGTETVGTFEKFVAATVITVTNGVPIAATGSYQPLASADAVGTTLAVAAAGTRICYVNTVAQNIVITDTTTTMLTGNITLNQYDTLCVLSDGTNMIMLSTTNN